MNRHQENLKGKTICWRGNDDRILELLRKSSCRIHSKEYYQLLKIHIWIPLCVWNRQHWKKKTWTTLWRRDSRARQYTSSYSGLCAVVVARFQKLTTEGEVRAVVDFFFQNLNSDCYALGIKELDTCYNSCLDNFGDYM